MRIFLFVLFANSILLQPAFADAGICHVPEYVKKDTRAIIMAKSQCICSDAAKSYPYKVPRNFRIVASCGTPSYGPYYFEGMQRMSGHISRMETTTFGDHISLQATNELSADGVLSHFYFYHEDNVVRRFNLPPLTKATRCWKAPVVVDIMKFNVDLDSNDSSGAYLHTYKVISIGEYVRCKGESAD